MNIVDLLNFLFRFLSVIFAIVSLYGFRVAVLILMLIIFLKNAPPRGPDEKQMIDIGALIFSRP